MPEAVAVFVWFVVPVVVEMAWCNAAKLWPEFGTPVGTPLILPPLLVVYFCVFTFESFRTYKFFGPVLEIPWLLYECSMCWP